MELTKKDNYFEVWCCDILQASWNEIDGLAPMHEVYPCCECNSKDIVSKDPTTLEMVGKTKERGNK